jgi:phospholipid transport system substrate-binding protein
MPSDSRRDARHDPSRDPRRDPGRRRALGLICAGAGLALVPGRARALTAASAERLVDSLVTDINGVINSGKSEAQMYPEFERIFARYGDVPTIARYVLGVDARRATAAQLDAFTKAYQRYVSRKYGRRFREFIGGRLEIQGSRQVQSYIEVRTIAYLRGESPFEVTFSVSDRSGRDKFFNMTIEGVNMLLTERTEVGALLDRRGGDIDALIRELQSA